MGAGDGAMEPMTKSLHLGRPAEPLAQPENGTVVTQRTCEFYRLTFDEPWNPPTDPDLL